MLCSIDRAPAADVNTPRRRQQQDASLERTKQITVDGKWTKDVAVGDPTGGAAAAPTAATDTSVAIGGVEELLEFVRSHVLAGPRPFSFAFHEQSLR